MIRGFRLWAAGALPAVVAATLAPAIAAAQSPQPPADKPPSIYDRIWKPLTTWHDDNQNRIVQRVIFTGRFQYDLARVDAAEGEHDEANIRRLRFGPRITIFKDYLVHVEVELNPQERDPLYARLTDAYASWQKHPRAVISIGKQSVPFTQEGATSSKDLITIDRSNLVNNIWFTQEYMPGVSLSGRAAPWSYRGGVYSSGAMNREFGRFSGDMFTLAILGYDFGPKLRVREAVLTGNYVYQHPDVNNTFTKRFEQIGSINFKVEQPRWGARADLSLTAGYLGQDDIVGVMLMGFANLTPKLQFVARHTRLESDGANGLSLASYENKVVSGRGDAYTEGYFGVNYYFYGHRLKIQSGVQFGEMTDRANDGGAYAGTSWTTGLRVGW